MQLLRRHCTSSFDLTGGAQEVWLSCPRVVIVMQRSLLLIEEAERADGTPVTLLLGKDGDPQRHMWIHCSKRVLSLSLSLSLSLPVILSPFCFYSLLGGSGAFPPFTLMMLNETLSCDFDLV